MKGQGNKRHYVEFSANEKAGLAKHATEWSLFGGCVLAEYARISLCYEWIRHQALAVQSRILMLTYVK